MAVQGWRDANVPATDAGQSGFQDFTAEELAERERMLALVPDGPPPRKKGKKAIPLTGDKLVAVLKYHGIGFNDGRSRTPNS